MSCILAIDPGTRYLGCAWGATELEGALLLGYKSLPRLQGLLTRWIVDYGKPVHLVIERPVLRTNSRVRPQSILDLMLVVGACSVHAASKIDYVAPSTWGATGKATPEARLRTEQRIHKHLAAEERSRVKLPGRKTLDHNVWDAVGIWLWASRRYR